MQTAIARSFGLKPVTRRVSFLVPYFDTCITFLLSSPRRLLLCCFTFLFYLLDISCDLLLLRRVCFVDAACRPAHRGCGVGREQAPFPFPSTVIPPLSLSFIAFTLIYEHRSPMHQSFMSQGSRQVTRAAVEFYGPGKSLVQVMSP
jgi:hypothetical protein